MLKMLTAYTHEADDTEAAVADILAQLDLPRNALAHSAGLVVCYSDFVDTGVVRALCSAVPFEVVGCTSLAMATAGQLGTVMLTFTVFTSDDVVFSTALADGLGETQQAPIAEAYARAEAALAGKPAGLCLTFAPMLGNVGGEKLSRALNEAAGGTPVFGTIACDDNPDYEEARVICGGDAYQEGMAMLLMGGEVHPRFFMASIPEHKIQKQKAVITKAHDNIIHEVNGLPFLEYAKTLGLTEGDAIEGSNTIPLIIDYGDGTKPVAAAIYALQEDGAVCGVPTPENATLAIGSIDVPDVLATTKQQSGRMTEADANGFLAFPCLARVYVLGAEPTAELELLREAFGKTPFLAAYAGGEFCPVYLPGGAGTVNRFHNFTFIGCAI